MEAQSCYSLGNTYTLLRDYPMAVEYHLRHLIIAQQLMDRVGEGMLQLNVVIDFSSAEHLCFTVLSRYWYLLYSLPTGLETFLIKSFPLLTVWLEFFTLLHLFPPFFPLHSEFLFYSSSIYFCLPNSWCTVLLVFSPTYALIYIIKILSQAVTLIAHFTPTCFDPYGSSSGSTAGPC